MQYPGIDDPNTWILSEVLRTQASNLGSRTAIRFVDRGAWTYRDCLEQGEITASKLDRLGIGAGDKVAIMVDDPVEFCRLWFGISILGAVGVAINTALKGQVLQHQFTNSLPALVVADEHAVDGVLAVIEAIDPRPLLVCTSHGIGTVPPLSEQHPLHTPADVRYGNRRHSDLACIMYTSGTSGPSKGVLMPEAHCFMFGLGTIENQRLRDTDVMYICLPLFHANGLFMQLYACLIAGCLAVVRGRFSASKWLDDIRTHHATHTNMLGAIASFIVARAATEEDRNHRLKVVTSAPLPPEPERILRERFGVNHVLPLYGMTEVNIPLYGSIGESTPGTCGRVYERWFEVEIRDPETDIPVHDGETGEIMVRPKYPFCFMSGYLNMDAETVQAWRNFWFHTGDAGLKRADGHFVFVDRIKDCIRRRGENISSYEVEQAFLDLPGVTEAAAYAVPAEGEGMEDEVMVAILATPSHDLAPRAVRHEAEKRLARFALPRYIRIMEDFPKTPTGKVQKARLRAEGITQDTWDAERC